MEEESQELERKEERQGWGELWALALRSDPESKQIWRETLDRIMGPQDLELVLDAPGHLRRPRQR